MGKELIIEEDEPMEVEKTKKRTLDAGGGGNSSAEDILEWDTKESTPLVPKGGKPKFVENPADKHNVDEGHMIYVTFQIEGDPVPEVEWLKDEEKDMSCNPRAKVWTDGINNNSITMGIKGCLQKDEGDYKCVIKNSKGKVEFDFKLYVTVEGGMDFRAMLMKKKRKEKKVVVKKVDWIEPLVSQEVEQGSVPQIALSCKLSVGGKRGKWYQRNEEIMLDIKSGEFGRECIKGDKYDWKTEGEDTYILYINNPSPKDDGTYFCLVKELDTHTSCYLTVKAKNPEYYFVKPFAEKEYGYTNRPKTLSVEMNEPGAKFKWLMNGKVFNWHEQKRFTRVDDGCVHSIHFPLCELDDSSYYSVQIEQFVKNGEDDQTNCWFEVQEYPHTFTSKLQEKRTIEKDQVIFSINTEAEDATVRWFWRYDEEGVKKIIIDGERIREETEGKERRLVINNVTMEDAGEVVCKTNKDISRGKLVVALLNEITKELTSDGFRSIIGMVFVVEREEVIFYVEVKDPGAPVTFYIDSQQVDLEDTRFIQTDLGAGKHKLVVKHTKMTDAGTVEVRTPTNKGDNIAISTTMLDVMKGETVPKMGKIGKNNKVVGVARKECKFEIPFAVEGKKQSELEMKIEIDGKELKEGKDITVKINEITGKVDVQFINPKREKGQLKVSMGNAQGICEASVDVNIMDKPVKPEKVQTKEVSYDSCTLAWGAPIDDGGTEIVKYIVEEQDLESGSDWSQTAEVGPNETKANIKNLKNGGKYRFRIVAVNKLGQSVPCETMDDIIIDDKWKAPSQPGTPNILDWGPTHCDMSWAPPETDGGAPITHYQIELNENNVGWLPGELFTIEQVRQQNGLVFSKCGNLLEESEYKFRVKAINLRSNGGFNYSVPSEPSKSMIAKTRYINASIKQPGMFDIEVKAGKTFRYDIYFNGEPMPDAIWEHGGTKIEPDERTTVEIFDKNGTYCERNSVLTVRNANRKKDTGEYKIRLLCGGGNYAASGYVSVLDVPDKPRSFSLLEVTSEYCNLSWDEPEDDGGAPVQQYRVWMMELGLGEWVQVSEVKERRTRVNGMKPGNLYRFLVTAVNKEGESKPAKLPDPVTAQNPFQPPGEPCDPTIVDYDEKSVTLRWGKPAFDGGVPISHYIIEKKDNFGGWYTALVTDDDNTSATIAELEARIPGLSLGKDYQFRVVAVSKAGESFPSVETKPHLCRYKNLEPIIDQSASSKSTKVNRMMVWKITVKGVPSPTFTWFKGNHKLELDNNFRMKAEEVAGSPEGLTVATLQITRAQMEDAGTYTLKASNANGEARVDLDLVVMDSVVECQCDMFSQGSRKCQCFNAFRADQIERDQSSSAPQAATEMPNPLDIPVNPSLPLCRVANTGEINLRSKCDLEFFSGRNRDTVSFMLRRSSAIRGF